MSGGESGEEHPVAGPQPPVAGPPLPVAELVEAPPRAKNAPLVEPPSPDVAPVEAEFVMPGTHRGGFERWPTAPVSIAQSDELAQPPVAVGQLVLWAPPEPPAPYRGVAAWSLAVAIVALFISMFVGWGFPLGLVAIVTAIIALRRPLESRGAAVWALVLGVVSVLYSTGWLLWAAGRADFFG